MHSDKALILIILLGLFIRLYLIPIAGFKIDVTDWASWSDRLNNVGYSNFYSKDIFSDYAPGYMYVLNFLGNIKNLFHLNNSFFYMLLKLPAIISDLILGLLIYKEISKYTSIFYSRLGILFIYLNPALIFNSAIWGQIDSVPILPLFLAIIYLKRKKLILSSLCFGLAFLIKPQSIAILPVYCLFLNKNFSIKNLIKITLPFLLVISLLSIPFFKTNPLIELWLLIQNSANQYPYLSLFAYNFWGALGFWVPDTKVWIWEFTYQKTGYILLSIYWMIISYLFIKKKISLYAISTLSLLGFFFLSTRIHERYLYPSIILLTFFSIYAKSRILLLLTIVLSSIHFLNLYYVYVYYNELYLKLPKVLYNSNLYNFLDVNGKLLSLLSTIIFFTITWVIIKSKHAYKQS